MQFDWPVANEDGGPPYLCATLAQAIWEVKEGGTIHIEPGATGERLDIGFGKRFMLVAPIGGVTIGKA